MKNPVIIILDKIAGLRISPDKKHLVVVYDSRGSDSYDIESSEFMFVVLHSDAETGLAEIVDHLNLPEENKA